MNTLNDLKQQLSVLLIKYADEYGNYRSAIDIYEDIGVLYQKFYNAGVSTSDMKLLDKVCNDIMKDWDRLINEENKSCCNGTQTRKDFKSIGEYTLLVGQSNKEFTCLL